MSHKNTANEILVSPSPKKMMDPSTHNTPGLDQAAASGRVFQEEDRANQSIVSHQLPSSSIWQPDEWSYAAEGGKHALFRYSGTDGDFNDHLLRVAKSDLANASSLQVKNDDDEEPNVVSASLRTCKLIEFMNEPVSQSFHRKIVQPLLGHQYLDLARSVRLPASCCTQLYDRTLESGVIPPSRLPTWKVDNDVKCGTNNIGSIIPESVKASLLRDHTRLSPHPLLPTPASPSLTSEEYNEKNSHPTILSVEIKPKAGFITSSPLVLPDHRCKYYQTRYSLQQELMQKGHVQKGWRKTTGTEDDQNSPKTVSATMQNEFIPSSYSPLDLFAGNLAQIQNALKDLSESMQNNFRVWCNGKQIFGEYDTPSDDECQAILNDIFDHSREDDAREPEQPPTDPKSILLNVITRTVSRVLDRESLLSNMLAMQQLDVIDGDGAVMIYDRLVELCEGSNIEAERILDDAASAAHLDLFMEQKESTGDGCSSSSEYLFAASPYTIPKCNALDTLLDAIAEFQTHIHSRIETGSSPDADVVNAAHIKCTECIGQLSKEACIYLLQNWLLSLALCDVSFFVTFQFLTDSECQAKEGCQTCDHGGIALCSMQDDDAVSCNMGVHYEVKIVDCDPKPAKKLRSRRDVENKFQFV